MESEATRAVKVIAALAEAEVNSEWQRKSSFETRAFALLTANLAIATLFLAISEKLKVFDGLTEGTAGTLALIALIGSALSVACAVIAALPMNAPTPPAKTLEVLLAEAADSTSSEGELLAEIANTRLGQLSIAVAKNRIRGYWTAAAFLALGLSAATLIASIIVSVKN